MVLFAAMETLAWGADPFLATWKMRSPTPPQESSILQITANGVTHRLVYRMTYSSAAGISPVVETFVSNLDGRESTAIMANGGQAMVKMAVTRVDDRHWTAVVRTNGTLTSTSKVEVSADGKVLRIDSESHLPGGKTLPGTQYWDKQ
jgi:hypothetical protein